MAEPVRGTPVLTGQAAKRFLAYMKDSKPDPEKQKRIDAAMETHARIQKRDAANP